MSGEPIDIMKLADEILLEGTRRETSVSQLEIRAMAAGLLGISGILAQSARCVTLIGELGAGPRPAHKRQRQDAEDALLLLAEDLVKSGYLGERDVKRLRS